LPEYCASCDRIGDVKTVVLRVNSPGGSATTSEVIQRLTGQVKPVVVSMGNVAHLVATGL